jgi:hypothetical protein
MLGEMNAGLWYVGLMLDGIEMVCVAQQDLVCAASINKGQGAIRLFAFSRINRRPATI